ncbi:MAG: DNA replication/repair protein RecF [Acidimicrobiia bacterium]
MRLGWIELREYRSYRELRFEPSAGTNILVGDNGAGKTNVLEAIWYLSGLKSFRRDPDEALIRDDAAAAVVRGGVERESGEIRVEIEIPRRGRRRVLLNGKRPHRLGDVASEVPVVAFLPNDLDLVKRGPALRRDFLDDLGRQLMPATGANLAEYEKALRQRNALLRASGRAADRLTLDVWDERLSLAGGRVLVDRVRLIREIGPLVEAAYERLGGCDLTLVYEAAWLGATRPDTLGEGGAGELLRTALVARRERDLDQRSTSTGPHRDDMIVTLGRRPVRSQASQGEQRSAALALRLAAYGSLRRLHGVAPILLLDDVFSELDAARAAAVRELLPGGQVFVTSARDDEAHIPGTRWGVGNGKVTYAA